MRPKWDEVSDLAKADKICCACFCAHTRAQGYVPLAHVVLVISDDPEGDQHIIAAYVEKKKTWEEAKNNTSPDPKLRGQCATSSDRSPPIPDKDPPPATARPNYWDSLGSELDNYAEFRSELDITHPQGAAVTQEVTDGGGVENLANHKKHY